jgi:hypothetical protein
MTEQPSQHVKDILDMDLMQLAMFTWDALHSMKVGAPVSIMRMKLETLVKVATTSLKDLDAETMNQP